VWAAINPPLLDRLVKLAGQHFLPMQKYILFAHAKIYSLCPCKNIFSLPMQKYILFARAKIYSLCPCKKYIFFARAKKIDLTKSIF